MEVAILSYNIRCDTPYDGANAWPHRKELVAQRVLESEADVVAFQEVLAHQAEFLKHALPNYVFYGRGRQADGGGEQCTIAVRESLEVKSSGTFWLSPSPELPGSVGWDAMLPRICSYVEIGGVQPFTVFNTHFDHVGEVATTESARLILDRMSRLQHPAVLAGDFNSTPESETHACLTEHLCDRVEPDEICPGTYHAYGKVLDRPRIDYIMPDSAWNVLESRILVETCEPYSSDHFPVYARLGLPSWS